MWDFSRSDNNQPKPRLEETGVLRTSCLFPRATVERNPHSNFRTPRGAGGVRGFWSEQNPESAPNKRGLADMIYERYENHDQVRTNRENRLHTASDNLSSNVPVTKLRQKCPSRRVQRLEVSYFRGLPSSRLGWIGRSSCVHNLEVEGPKPAHFAYLTIITLLALIHLSNRPIFGETFLNFSCPCDANKMVDMIASRLSRRQMR